MATMSQSRLACLSVFLLAVCALILLWPGAKREPIIKKEPPADRLPVASIPPVHHAPVPTTGEAQKVPPTPVAGVKGLVLGERDEPVSGAKVYWTSDRSLVVDEAEATETDAAGRFAIGLESAEGSNSLRVLAVGYLPWTQTVDRVTDTDLRVVLSRGESIAGTVVDIWGKGVPGARVWCHSPRNRSAWPNPSKQLPADADLQCVGGVAMTDAEGHFQVIGLQAGKYEVRATKQFYGYVGSDLPPIVASHTNGLTLVLAPLARLVVCAVDEQSHAPLPFAQMSMFMKGGTSQTLDVMTHEYTTDSDQLDTARASDGCAIMTFAAGNLPPGVTEFIPGAKIVARAPGYEENRVQVDIPYGKSTRVEIPLKSKAPGEAVIPIAVKVVAECVGGKAFSGKMCFEIRDSARPKVVGLWYTTFTNGIPVQALALPEGQYAISPIGPLDAAGTFSLGGWGEATTVGVGRGSKDSECKVIISANPVRLVVTDAKGRKLDGFDLSVNTESSGGLARRWDIRRQRETSGTDGCVVWLPAGNVTVAMSMPGHSQEVRKANIPGDGQTLELAATLADDLRDAEESDPQRR